MEKLQKILIQRRQPMRQIKSISDNKNVHMRPPHINHYFVEFYGSSITWLHRNSKRRKKPPHSLPCSGFSKVIAYSPSAVSMFASTFWLSRTKACLVRPAETPGLWTLGLRKKPSLTGPAAA